MQWARMQVCVHRELSLLVHITNEGKRSPAAAGIAKAMGLTKGVWDYLLPVMRLVRYPTPISRAARPVGGLWIEMKKPKGKLTDEQKWWGDEMVKQGYATVVCYDWPQARAAILSYLRGNHV
jgi:hypothetical protein